MSEDVGGEADGRTLLRSVLTTRGQAWMDPADVKSLRRVADDERKALGVPPEWMVALRLRIRGDEAWIVRGDPMPPWLAEVLADD